MKKPVEKEVHDDNYRNLSQTWEKESIVIKTNGDVNQPRTPETNSRQSMYESMDSNNDTRNMHTHVTQVRNEIRSSTATPEPVQERLTQEIVWVPETQPRRGSYTIEKSDGNGFIERYENSEVIPVENGAVHISGSGVRGASCTEEHSSEVVKKDGFLQNVNKRVNNSSAHEQSQKSSEEVRTGSDIQHLPDGGIAQTTTTTTIKKMGKSAKTANATTTVTRTNTVVTARDVGAK